jgi:hypothetical protein
VNNADADNANANNADANNADAAAANNAANVGQAPEGDPPGHPQIVLLVDPSGGSRMGNRLNAQREQQWERIESNHPSTLPCEAGELMFGDREVGFARDSPWFTPLYTNNIAEMDGRWTADGYSMYLTKPYRIYI